MSVLVQALGREHVDRPLGVGHVVLSVYECLYLD